MNNIKEKIDNFYETERREPWWRDECYYVIDGIEKIIEQEEKDTIFLRVPRKVKLSEIVEKLSPHYKYFKIFYNSEINAIGFKEPTSNYFIRIVEFDNNKISLIYLYTSDNNKWLYTMWITGTEVIIDE